MQKLQKQESRLQGRVDTLHEKRKELAAVVADSFGKRKYLRLSGSILLRLKNIVYKDAVIDRKGYSYPDFKEIQG